MINGRRAFPFLSFHHLSRIMKSTDKNILNFLKKKNSYVSTSTLVKYFNSNHNIILRKLKHLHKYGNVERKPDFAIANPEYIEYTADFISGKRVHVRRKRKGYYWRISK